MRMPTLQEVRALHDLPLPELLFRAQTVHRQHHAADEVQLCTLLSVKTGGCPEDCAYCPQSSHYETPVSVEKSLAVDEVLGAAKTARESGATRFCMGAAWREVKDGPAFDNVLAMVRGVRGLGMEACVTLGMLNDDQARRLKEAGLTAYNHNLDTSRQHYKSIISTRTYDDRLATLDRVRKAGITVCSGGIIGMGESIDDRCEMLRTLASLDPQPESVPINTLVATEGTPLSSMTPVEPLELVRMIATARILMPRSRVRLSAGRLSLSKEAQLLCFFAGANSIFYGEKLLTTGNPDVSEDQALLAAAGLRAAPVEVEASRNCSCPCWSRRCRRCRRRRRTRRRRSRRRRPRPHRRARTPRSRRRPTTSAPTKARRAA
jgi:biotin synthase